MAQGFNLLMFFENLNDNVLKANSIETTSSMNVGNGEHTLMYNPSKGMLFVVR